MTQKRNQVRKVYYIDMIWYNLAIKTKMDKYTLVWKDAHDIFSMLQNFGYDMILIL